MKNQHGKLYGRKGALILALAAILPLASLAAACGGSSSPESASASAVVPSGAEISITVYKSPTCSCCSGWEEYLRKHGFNVTSVPTDDLDAVNEQYGIPSEVQPCHTAVIGDYVVGGHIPVEFIAQLLTERPEIDGIALAGMPAGTPGMGGTREGALTVYAIKDGETSIFGEF